MKVTGFRMLDKDKDMKDFLINAAIKAIIKKVNHMALENTIGKMAKFIKDNGKMD